MDGGCMQKRVRVEVRGQAEDILEEGEGGWERTGMNTL